MNPAPAAPVAADALALAAVGALDALAPQSAAQRAQAQWQEALSVAALLAVDPHGLGGVRLCAGPGPARDAWLAQLRALLPAGTPLRRVPLGIADGRLLGGLDLAATLRLGRPVAERGVLAETDGGVLLLAMAERLEPATAAKLAATLDAGCVQVERDGIAAQLPARLGMVALDEGRDDDEERTPAALAERLAFWLALPDAAPPAPDPAQAATAVLAARARYPQVQADAAVLEALVGAAAALGVDSARAALFAVRAARAAAALAGRPRVADEDAALAARVVLAPRATVLPLPPPPAADETDGDPPDDSATDPPADPPDPPDPAPQSASDSAPPPPAAADDPAAARQPLPRSDQPLDDVVLAAARAAIPAGLLARLAAGLAPRVPARAAGRAGAQQAGRARGRPAGARRGMPRGGQRLNVIETLRAAAPWQPLRRRERAAAGGGGPRIAVRHEDFRITRRRQRTTTTTVFVVDASGSSALHRLAEAKGAVELLLADCYVRRDRVALIGFRHRDADLLLPPTRSLVRARRCLAGLPGGGGTPLAAALDAAAQLAAALRRRGDTPVLVLLTDGRANVARDGRGGREAAHADALAAARALRALGCATLLVDTSPRASAPAAEVAAALGGRYLPLPHADARRVARAVQAAGAIT